jgi:hypothetical protein
MHSPKREIVGQWWLPSAPEEKWVGTLAVEPNKAASLSVTIPRPIRLFEMKAPPVIHGHDKQGRPISLLFPGWPQTSSGMAMAQATFKAGYAVLGIHLVTASEFRVNVLTLRAQHLYDWLGITGFQRVPWDSSVTYRIDYCRPEDQFFQITAELRLKIHPTDEFCPGSPEAVIREDICLSFYSQSGLDLKRCQQLITALRHLLHLAALSPVYMLSISGTKAGYGYDLGGRFSHHDLTIHNSIIREPVEPDPRWVFRFTDLQPRFAQFFAQWLDFLERYDEAFGCYSTTVYHRLPDSVEHLCLTQALEAYHGIKHESHKSQDFPAKIQDLATQFLPHLQGLVPDPAAFAEAVRDNRNYYTHHNPKWLQAGRVVDKSALLRLNEKLKLLFQMCLLSEIGIPVDRFAILRRQLATDIIDYV